MITIYNLFLSFILIVLIVFLFIIDKKQNTEWFETNKINQTKITKQFLTTNLENMSSILPGTAENVDADFMETMVKVLNKGGQIPDNWQGTTLCLDPVNTEAVITGNKGTKQKLDTEGYFIRLKHPDRIGEKEYPYEIAKRKIGVFDICEKHLVKSIAYGYRIPDIEPVVNVEYIPKQNWDKLEELLKNRYDVIYAYIIKGSSFEKRILQQQVYITGFDKIDITRINVTFPYVTLKKTYMSDIFNWKENDVPKALYNKDGTLDLLWCPHFMFVIGDPKKVVEVSPSIETFITNLTISKEMSDPAYRCYGELTNENRALCNSSYDQWGKEKTNQTYWDIPCLENTDCPYYKANKNYPNEFGKCMSNGICEFPVGVRRLAYRKYQDTFPYNPMCYGCDPTIVDCCEDQAKNPTKYPGLYSPDYAFPDDITARSLRKLQTVIPLDN